MSSPAPKTFTFSTSTVRNQRTLIWLQHQAPSVSWWKWDGVVNSLEDYHRWSAQGATLIGIVLADVTGTAGAAKGSEEQWLEEVYHVAKKVQFVLLPRQVIQWKSEEYWKENFDNVFVLEDIHESYPFVGGVWDGTAGDAVHLLALLCRYHRLVDAPPTTRPMDGRILAEGIRPPEFVLFTQFYISSAKKRTQELRECLRRNAKCRWVDRIVLLNERDESCAWASLLPKDAAKIEQQVLGRRLTYADFFREVVRRYHGTGLDAVVALANADIYFKDELAEAWRIQWEDRAICLLRWDDLGKGASSARLFGPRADSQDVWMFSAASVANRHWTWKDVDIPLGKPGCDNAILYPLLQQRFLLSNPALSLKAYHLHNSGVRSYGNKDTVFSPVYIHLEPTYLVDTKQEFTPKESPQYLCNEVVPFTVRSSSMSNEITYCTMLEKEGRYRWEPTVENSYFEPAIPVYRWGPLTVKSGAGVTPNGLVYDLFHIYTGRDAIQRSEYNYWPSASVDIFTPLYSCKRMLAIPLQNAPLVFGDMGVYLLFYFSRVLRIKSMFRPDVSLHFWMPSSGSDSGAGSGAVFGVEGGLPWNKSMACWAEEVVGYLPGPSVSELGREDIMMLRGDKQWREAPFVEYGSGGRTCIVVGDDLLTDEWCQRLRGLLPASWRVVRVRTGVSAAAEWFGASLCILVGGPDTHARWAPIWRLPKGAVLLEFQQELAVSGECQHVAHVADLSSWIMLLSKDSVEGVREAILSCIKGWWVKHHAAAFPVLPSASASSASSASPSRSLPHS